MGHSAVFECPVGYRLEGASSITCQYNGTKQCLLLANTVRYKIKKIVSFYTGKWSTEVPHCEKIKCPEINIRDNALLELNEHNNTYGEKAVFTCMWGYKLSGSQSMTCEGDGKWNGSMPTCLSKTEYFSRNYSFFKEFFK